jgi:hypothetical protein
MTLAVQICGLGHQVLVELIPKWLFFSKNAHGESNGRKSAQLLAKIEW